MKMRPLIFNGKFYSGRLNGVHRVADRLVRQVDRLLAAMPEEMRPPTRIFVPERRLWSPEVSTMQVTVDPGAHSQFWEQVTLPRLANGGVLINLCNLAPLMHSRKLLLVHDAQFLFADNSYPTKQRLRYKYLIPLMARRSQSVLTISDYSRRILDLAGISKYNDMSVSHNGGDHLLDVTPNKGVLSEHALTAGRFVVVFGTSKAYKNVEIIFRAFHDGRLFAQTLVVVGDDERSLRADGLVPPAGTKFLGPVDDGRLRALYEHATCLVFPSKTEGFGLPPLEAMSLGCPVIVAPGGAIPEVCHDAVVYSAIDDVEDWIGAILAIATDETLRHLKIAAGRQRAAKFTWEQAGQRLLGCALELARKPK